MFVLQQSKPQQSKPLKTGKKEGLKDMTNRADCLELSSWKFPNNKLKLSRLRFDMEDEG
jgi:hypothetical protein